MINLCKLGQHLGVQIMWITLFIYSTEIFESKKEEILQLPQALILGWPFLYRWDSHEVIRHYVQEEKQGKLL